jgi:hypothetical protein
MNLKKIQTLYESLTPEQEDLLAKQNGVLRYEQMTPEQQETFARALEWERVAGIYGAGEDKAGMCLRIPLTEPSRSARIRRLATLNGATVGRAPLSLGCGTVIQATARCIRKKEQRSI